MLFLSSAFLFDSQLELYLRIFQEWAQLGGHIVETTIALVAAEKEAFESLRMDVSIVSNGLLLVSLNLDR